MSVRIETVYQGSLRCESVHTPSHSRLLTDAPVDNCGRGEAFSPTDLVATALGTCMLTTMAIFAQRHAVELSGATVSVEKEMVAQPARRIGQLTCSIAVPLSPDHPLRTALEEAARQCPVHRSLHPDVAQPLEFRWQPAGA